MIVIPVDIYILMSVEWDRFTESSDDKLYGYRNQHMVIMEINATKYIWKVEIITKCTTFNFKPSTQHVIVIV